MNLKFLFFSIAMMQTFVFISCNKKKASLVEQTLQNKLNKPADSLLVEKNKIVDSTPLQIVKEDYSKQVDSISKFHQLKYNTIAAEASINYSDNNQSYDINAYIRSKKDSIIWISTEVFMLEIFRVIIRPNDIMVMDKFSNQYKKMTFSDLEKILGFPVNFKLIQDIVIGNPIQLSDSIQNIKKENDNLVYDTQNENLKSIVRYIFKKKQISVNSLETIQNNVVPTVCTIYHSSFQEIKNNVDFAMQKNIVIKGRVNSFIKFDFKKINLDITQNYPFPIPKNYSTIK